MEFWEDNKLAITGCGAALLVLLLLYVFLFAPVGRSAADLADQNEEWDGKLAEYYPEGGMSVNLLLSDFQLSNTELRKYYKTLKEKMTAQADKAFAVPVNEPQPGFFFRRLLTKKRYGLMVYTSRRSLDSIDETLGFGESVPDDEAVPGMLSDLTSACEIVKIAADSGVRTIEKLEHAGVSKKGAPGLNPFIKEHELRMSMMCDLVALMKFLHGLGDSQRFFGLRGLTVESPGRGKEKLLEVEVVCATFSFFEPAKAAPDKKPDGPGPKGPAPTYGL